MSWLEVLVNWLDRFWPLVFIRPYQRGVAFVCGRWVYPVRPGVMLKVVGVLDVDVVDVVEQIVDLEVQSITTRDEKAICVRAAVRYAINDPVSYLTEVLHTDKSILNLCEVHLHQQIRRRPLPAILKSQRGLESAIMRALAPEAAKWGVEVRAFSLTHLVIARHFKLYNQVT